MIASTECSASNGDFSLKARCTDAWSLSPIDVIVRRTMDADLIHRSSSRTAVQVQCRFSREFPNLPNCTLDGKCLANRRRRVRVFSRFVGVSSEGKRHLFLQSKAVKIEKEFDPTCLFRRVG